MTPRAQRRYAGNTKYNEYNKGALDAVGGKTGA